ncbi:MAG: HDOD domain-containing protein [Nitrospirae bacterium]|nr:HDOD domain-containing protein [Nitrospirota bacterium]
MDTYIARQPIFDREKHLFAYELLFRDGLSNFFPQIDGDTATSKVLSSSFLSIGMETITGGKRAFINFTHNLLMSEIPFMFPRETTVVEILEDVKPDPAVIETCRRLSSEGYYIALDDFFFTAGIQALVKLVNLIKIDFRLMPIDDIKKMIVRPELAGIKLLAEKIETNEEFKVAFDMGFEYFQGYFFSKPEIIKGKELSGSALQLLNLIIEINKPTVNLEKLEKIIEHDVSITYKLLRYVNSASIKRRTEISSIRKAVMVIGIDELKRLVSLISLSKVAVDKPDELIKSACIKARFCEKLGQESSCSSKYNELFLIGLFAHMDAILDQPMKVIMEKIPISKTISDALINGEGEAVNYLRLAEYYQKGEWDNVKKYAGQTCVGESVIPGIYIEACKWADEFSI